MTNFANDAPLYFARVLRNSGNKPMRCRDILVRACIDGLDAGGVPDAEAAADRLLTESDMFAGAEPGYFMMDDRKVVRFPVIPAVKEQLVDPTAAMEKQPDAVETKTVRFSVIPAKKEAPASQPEVQEAGSLDEVLSNGLVIKHIKEIPDIVIEKRKPVGKIAPSAQQAAAVDAVKNRTDNLIIEAKAGTGKTTLLMMIARELKKTALIVSYNKKIADELKEKVQSDPELNSRTFGVDHVETGTVHSVGYKICAKYLPKGFELIKTDGGKSKRIMEPEVEAGRIRKDYVNCIADTVSKAKLSGFVNKENAGFWGKYLVDADDDAEWMNMIYHFGTDEAFRGDERAFSLELLVHYSKMVLKMSNKRLDIVDYDDLLLLPLEYKDWKPRFRRHNILIDEAQDTNCTRRVLMAKMMAKGGRLIACGDSRQSIYAYQGASSEAINEIGEMFNVESILPLSQSFRCPQDVIKLAQTIVPEIEPVDTAPKGRVMKIKYDDMLASLCKMDRSQYQHTAILCRLNRHLVSLCFALIRSGVPAKMEGRDIGKGLVSLARKWKITTTKELRERITDYREREIQKAKDEGRESAAATVDDKTQTLLVIIDNTELDGGTTVDDVENKINEIYDDNMKCDGEKKNPDVITLCSIHRAKGLEWPRVIHLGRKQFIPSPMAKKPHERVQENNACYVAITRAMSHAIDCYDVPVDTNPDIKPL